MNVFIDVLIVILLILASVSAVYLITSLKKITDSVESIQKDVSHFKDRFDPILIKVDKISEKVVVITDEVEEQVLSVRKVVDNVTDKVEGLLNLDKKIKENFDHSPVAGIYNRIIAVSKGVSAFWSTLTNKH